MGTDFQPMSRVGKGVFSFSINKKHLLYSLYILIIMVFSVLLSGLPFKFQLTLIMLIPAFLIVVLILKDPLYGVFLFFIYDYFRPYDFIPALRPLRLSMVVELLTLVSWLLYLKQTGKGLKWHKFGYLYLGFLAVVGVTIVTAHNNRWAFNTFQALGTYFIIFLITINRLDSIKKLNSLIWILLLIFGYYSVKGIFNFAVVGYVSAGERTSGVVGGSFLSDENDFALALDFMIPFAYFIFMESSRGIKKLICLGILLLMILGVIASASRGGLVGLAALIVYCILMSKHKLVGFGITGFLIIAAITFAPPGFFNTVSSITDTHEATAQTRIWYWEAGVRMFLDYPIVGVGAGNGPGRMPEYVRGFKDAKTQWGRTFHGTLPQVIAETGGLGLLFYMGMFFSAVSQLWKLLKKDFGEDTGLTKPLIKATLGSLIAYIVAATFLSTAYYPELWTLYIFTLILILHSAPQNQNTQMTENIHKYKNIAIGLFLLANVLPIIKLGIGIY